MENDRENINAMIVNLLLPIDHSYTNGCGFSGIRRIETVYRGLMEQTKAI